jgi:hypothetical protein
VTRQAQGKSANVYFGKRFESICNNLTPLIVDHSLSLTVELIDDTKETSEDAIGLATYSNIDSTAFAYISIFENLWMRTEK